MITGGEPLLQLDAPLIDALHARGFEIAVETNGTLPAPAGIDWICVSPKAGTEVVQRSGDELKLVWPQPGIDPGELSVWNFRSFAGPADGLRRAAAARAAAIDLVMARSALAAQPADPQIARAALSCFQREATPAGQFGFKLFFLSKHFIGRAAGIAGSGIAIGVVAA